MDNLARGGDPVSPELALVDPVLAEIERLRLAPVPPVPRARRLEVPPNQSSATVRTQSVSPKGAGAGWRQKLNGRSWSLVSAGTLAVLTLLLLDLKVEGGNSLASSEGLTAPPIPAVLPAARRATEPPPIPAVPPAARNTTEPSSRQTATSPGRRVRRFAWAPVAGASGYHVELFLGSRRVFSADSRDTALALPATWTYEGVKHALKPGEYRWYVWSVMGEARSGNAVVQARLTIS